MLSSLQASKERIVNHSSKASIVFIDSAVEECDRLIGGLAAGTEVFTLNPRRCGVEQITEFLAQRTDTSATPFIDTIHIVSHGSPGCLYLGNTQLSPHNLEIYAQQLQQWDKHLNIGNSVWGNYSQFSILLYGCNVAAGEIGKAFVLRLSQLTDADIAASINPTGSAAKGGDWQLQFFTAKMTVALAFDETVLKSYSHVLGGTTRYWKGAGADKYWSNPLNWSGDAVPETEDDVIFNDAGTKDVVLNIIPQIKSLTISPEYTGTLSGWHELTVLENVLIQGGTVNISLEAGGNITIENGTVNSYLSANGDLTIKNGTVAWNGGSINGNTCLSGGVVSFASNYNSYYIFYGNFIRAGGTTKGTPIFGFYGSNPQTFNAGIEGMTLRDLYNCCPLTLQGKVTLNGFFSNCGTLNLTAGATIDASAVCSYQNTGTILEIGTIVRQDKAKTLTSKQDKPVSCLTPSAGDQRFLALEGAKESLNENVLQTVQVTYNSVPTFV
ncbi:DUF4347 domain-containing protein [Microcoleus sp. FACHB-672]|uniref:DUF4347 domain-containing protein n=1 Tax=Microcoleus sp. FACHB-672 TaxID=2692825 RepID=UPI0016871AB1|nr:DUF4347 domain-containing protein [Microcoleus sp. FACHB-672]MBD2041048.1 DUF4347 domain-containing protein [Microcoleus sp. FACHB-672]